MLDIALTPAGNSTRHVFGNEQLREIVRDILPSRGGPFSSILPTHTELYQNDVYTCVWNERDLPTFVLTVNDLKSFHAIFPLDAPMTRKFLAAAQVSPPGDLDLIKNDTSIYGNIIQTQLGAIHDVRYNVTLRSTGPAPDSKDLVFATTQVHTLVRFLNDFLQAHGGLKAKFQHYRDFPEDFAPKKRPMHAPR